MSNDVSMPRLLNAREVAGLLGVPLYTLRDLVRKGEGPPHLRIRRVHRLPQAAVVQWIHDQTSSTKKGRAKKKRGD